MPIRKIRQIELAPAVSLPGSIMGSKIGLVKVESMLSKSYVPWPQSLASEFKPGQLCLKTGNPRLFCYASWEAMRGIPKVKY